MIIPWARPAAVSLPSTAAIPRDAAAAAKHFIDIFEEAEVIVCPSGSCVHMVRHHYPELFADDPAMRSRALAIGAKTFEFTQYLVDELGDKRCRRRIFRHSHLS